MNEAVRVGDAQDQCPNVGEGVAVDWPTRAAELHFLFLGQGRLSEERPLQAPSHRLLLSPPTHAGPFPSVLIQARTKALRFIPAMAAASSTARRSSVEHWTDQYTEFFPFVMFAFREVVPRLSEVSRLVVAGTSRVVPVLHEVE